MSRKKCRLIAYHPPKPYCDMGWNLSRYYNPWWKRLVDEYPCRIDLYVNLDHDGYYFWVEIHDWLGRFLRLPDVYAASDVDACQKAELVAEKWKAKLLPEWTLIALANKWRPPLNTTPKVVYLARETFEEKEYFPD